MDGFRSWLDRRINILPSGLEGCQVEKVTVHTTSKIVDIQLVVEHPVLRSELAQIEQELANDLSLKKVNIVPIWLDLKTLTNQVIREHREELRQIFTEPGLEHLFDDQEIEWEIDEGKLTLRTSTHSVWEDLVGTDICCRLAEWFKERYGVSIMVKASCREIRPCEEKTGKLVKFREHAFLESSNRSPDRERGKKKGKPAIESSSKCDNLPLVSIRELDEGMGKVAVCGQILQLDSRPLKGNRILFIISVSDYTDSIMVKHFGSDKDQFDFAVGDWIRVSGYLNYDNFEHETVLIAEKIEAGEEKVRCDRADRKRVELHAHTVMSALDGLTPVAALVETAARWGHSAVAITDHGVVQAFPEAYQVAKKAGIKVILGMEGYLVEEGHKEGRAYHIIILAKNQTGLFHLYQLVSRSYLYNFYRTPRITRQELTALREGLILGTACEAGELYQAVLSGCDDEELSRIANFYDYIEIQPLGNNAFMLREGTVKDEEELKEINRRLVALGRKLGKPVVATGDVHFLNPEDEIYRRILQAGKNMLDAEYQAPLYMRTTEEMLDEFSYLGTEEAFKVVVENPALIAAQIEELKPVPDELYTPSIEGADHIITDLSWQRAREIYGAELNPVVEQRLRRELDSIVGHGFANLYYIAHRLVKKSNEDGYLVGSRGSVGSSFVAFLTGITEVNPLPPHYVCPTCKYSEFILDGSVGCGADMPDKTCPKCGVLLKRDGFDIPFETFLGFDGDKVPDIDLNFSGEYQSKAHQFVEELFGKDKVFRAGTISTIAEKTAFGFVKKYMETNEIRFRKPEISRLVAGITGVKRTTGQHPGGLMIVPKEKDVHEFTPLQHPADDPNSGVITTHFDYHSISERLVKVDILGHDDPTMIRTLSDLTGFDARKVPLDEPKVMSLFSSTEALGVTPEQIRTPVGTYGIPEFGTKFVRQMLEATRPKTFSELIRISGLSHGTDVWLNNAQTLISEGRATLNEVIATRDDIMTYLIYKGLPMKMAFKIMENVRKGKGLNEEFIEEMRAHDVPEWYIASCQKIKYMFPKAHAVAYVMMAYRIAYYKVYYPRQFYAAYFSVRAEDFDTEAALAGYEAVIEHLSEIEKLGNNASPKEKNLLPILELILEALARGITFKPVDLYISDAKNFVVCDDGLLLPFTALPGVGLQAARSIVDARNQAPFTSIEDLQSRARLSSTVIDILRATGALKSLPESSQIALFA